MQYLLVCEPNTETLSARVTELLWEGWVLRGDPVVNGYESTTRRRRIMSCDDSNYCQALVRETSDPMKDQIWARVMRLNGHSER